MAIMEIHVYMFFHQNQPLISFIVIHVYYHIHVLTCGKIDD